MSQKQEYVGVAMLKIMAMTCLGWALAAAAVAALSVLACLAAEIAVFVWWWL